MAKFRNLLIIIAFVAFCALCGACSSSPVEITSSLVYNADSLLIYAERAYMHDDPKGLFVTAVAAAVKQRKNDLMNMTEDQAAFLAQKDLAGGKTTMRAYLWSVCGAEYDQQHG